MFWCVLHCDSCGRTLDLPATPDAANGWSRLSVRTRDGELIFRYTCGTCNPSRLLDRMRSY